MLLDFDVKKWLFISDRWYFRDEIVTVNNY